MKSIIIVNRRGLFIAWHVGLKWWKLKSLVSKYEGVTSIIITRLEIAWGFNVKPGNQIKIA